MGRFSRPRPETPSGQTGTGTHIPRPQDMQRCRTRLGSSLSLFLPTLGVPCVDIRTRTRIQPRSTIRRGDFPGGPFLPTLAAIHPFIKFLLLLESWATWKNSPKVSRGQDALMALRNGCSRSGEGKSCGGACWHANGFIEPEGRPWV